MISSETANAIPLPNALWAICPPRISRWGGGLYKEGMDMALSKKKRFEVFKRDGFTCQYCGQRPPEVVLEVDHITPKSKGGDGDPLNLITACFDCNRGKGARELASVSPSTAEQIAERKERTLQVDAFNRLLMADRKRRAKVIDGLLTYWDEQLASPEPLSPAGSNRPRSLQRFLGHRTPAELME